MKNISKYKLFPWIAILLLILVVIATAITIIIRHQQEGRINTALKTLQDNRQPLLQVESTLEALNMSENEFKEYTLTYDKIHLDNYRKNVQNLKAHIDTLRLMTLVSMSEDTVSQTLRLRSREAARYFDLNRLTDSLMVVLSTFDAIPLKNPDEKIIFKTFSFEKSNISIDTLGYLSTTKTKKKGLFGKIKSFLVGEEETKQISSGKVVVKKNHTASADTLKPANGIKAFATSIIDKSNTFYHNQLKQIIDKRNELRSSELKLIHMNNSLMQDIKGILDTMQTTLRENESHKKDASSKSISQSTSILHNVLLGAIVGVFLLALIASYLLRKASVDHYIIKASEQKAIQEAAEKSQFLAYMSHEFRCPISLVLGYIEQLEQTGLSLEQIKYMANLKFSSEILLTTVNDILDLSTLQSEQMKFLSEPFNPVEAIKKAIVSFDHMAKEKNLVITYNPDKQNSLVIGDEIRLRQIVTNLLSNAIKYTIKGEITITTSMTSTKEKSLFELKVADTGIGIPEDKIATIFDVYNRVHDEATSNWVIGSGLGLSVTRMLLENMGGTIDVKSTLNKGSEFTVNIAFTPYLEKGSATHISEKKSAQIPDNLRILIVDDNYLNISLLKAIFKRTNAILDFAENGQIALSKINTGKYDVILSDLYMPVMNGIELTRNIRNHTQESIRKLPIIVLSGNISPDITKQMIDAGISDYLLKPFQQEDLINRIVKQLR